jgi:RNA-dependent RNA polymerase
MFSDGVGTVSDELGDLIWKTLCDARRDGGTHAIKPSAVSASTLGNTVLSGVTVPNQIPWL